jgi:hypothetical protein
VDVALFRKREMSSGVGSRRRDIDIPRDNMRGASFEVDA